MTKPLDVPAACTQPAKAVGQRPYRWVQTSGPEATWVMITELTIPGVFSGEKREIPIEPCPFHDEEGMGILPPIGIAHGSADGPGGTGYNGGINVDMLEGSEDSVILNVWYSWRMSKQVKGVLNRKVPVRLGVPADVDLPGGAFLRVRWREIEETVKP